MKYVYPAVFTKEKKGYSINFPDLPGCYTCGDDLGYGIKMAEDVLAFTLYDLEKTSADIPEPSDISALTAGKNEFATLVACDTVGYQRMNNGRAVKKTLTIPQWMDELATERGVNFSKVLQDALEEKLDIS
ncbi:MAG: type II toxin-antitoxin system HicB family antitoxin [Clostridiales Family XIII bacterium]|jgi:predicted RNase H-like HicB family nuclease|nr:type II toxin-antitoxin system HicB family antitoxin [Clostridiales Family XIII bacterium]